MPPSADVAGHALGGHERHGGVIILGLEVGVDQALTPELVDVVRNLTALVGVHPVGQGAVVVQLVDTGRGAVQAEELQGSRIELFALQRESGDAVHLFAVRVGGMVGNDRLDGLVVAVHAGGHGQTSLLQPVPTDGEVTAHHVGGVAGAAGQLVQGAVLFTQQVDEVAVGGQHVLAVLLQIGGQLDGTALADESVGHGVAHAHDDIGIVVGGQHQVQALLGILRIHQLLNFNVELVLQNLIHARQALVFFGLIGCVVVARIVGELQGLFGNFPAVLVHGAGQLHVRHVFSRCEANAGEGHDDAQQKSQKTLCGHVDTHSFFILQSKDCSDNSNGKSSRVLSPSQRRWKCP